MRPKELSFYCFVSDIAGPAVLRGSGHWRESRRFPEIREINKDDLAGMTACSSILLKRPLEICPIKPVYIDSVTNLMQ